MFFAVAIDGPAGSGKSTITKRVAKELAFNYVDTGALYRSLTYNFLIQGLKELNEEKIKKILDNTKIKVYFDDFVQKQEINEQDVTDKIRTSEVSTYTSLFAKSKNVRDFLINVQRGLANSCNVIMDGRDIGSVVLPNANVKIYLTASVEERANRRYKEMLKSGNCSDISIEEIQKQISQRDYQDENRDIAPLIMVEDAIKIDTTEFTIDEVVDKIKNIILKKYEVTKCISL
ncbi:MULTISPECIES: (d)CMP kinase [unclassified Gemella]|uniref:(d)CMP kinase n=1 Tax=unclassified Gemella TaxID=2624949 RepID=UPI001C03E3E9|nr:MULTISPECIES: (d)CMP kinase [unclassified Gemella]MBU0278674.1 (d)CMP kinase [Gemella sp. zg-1178]QWQ39229.1 (d)CMP kinase [Gemella sp. zg-570]